MKSEALIVALGGNSISPEGEEGNIDQQFQRTRETMHAIVDATNGRFDRLIITHGNGPQIGNILLRSEMSAPTVYPLPLDTCVSDSEGGMGYMIQQVLHNVLLEKKINRSVVTVLTQTVVSKTDPAWQSPSKFIGKFHSKEDAEHLEREHGWHMREDSGRGWRRVVASPEPLEIVETQAIRALLQAGVIVVAAGGGGIPVTRDEVGGLCGAEAVVDKDLASALLARLLGIETMVILTGIERVSLNYGKPGQVAVERMTSQESEKHFSAGQFPSGSMGPKILAAIRFAQNGGRTIIAHPARIAEALEGKSGTIIANTF